MRVFHFLLICSLFFSCKFNKPIVSIRASSEVGVDTIQKTSFKKRKFYYFSLRNGICFGAVTVHKTFSDDLTLISKGVYKHVPARMHEGHERTYHKTITYDTILDQRIIKYQIFQKYGHEGKKTFEKTVIN